MILRGRSFRVRVTRECVADHRRTWTMPCMATWFRVFGDRNRCRLSVPAVSAYRPGSTTSLSRESLRHGCPWFSCSHVVLLSRCWIVRSDRDRPGDRLHRFHFQADIPVRLRFYFLNLVSASSALDLRRPNDFRVLLPVTLPSIRLPTKASFRGIVCACRSVASIARRTWADGAPLPGCDSPSRLRLPFGISDAFTRTPTSKRIFGRYFST